MSDNNIYRHSASVPTTGSNIVTVNKSKGEDQLPDTVSIR